MCRGSTSGSVGPLDELGEAVLGDCGLLGTGGSGRLRADCSLRSEAAHYGANHASRGKVTVGLGVAAIAAARLLCRLKYRS